MSRPYHKRTIQANIYRERMAYLAALRRRHGEWLASLATIEHRRGWFVISAPLFPGGQAPDLGSPGKVDGLRVLVRIRRRDLAKTIQSLEGHHE